MDKCMNKCIDEGWIYAVLNFINKYSKCIINKIDNIQFTNLPNDNIFLIIN